MPKYIKPKLTVTSNSASATTDPGPASIAINLSAAPPDGRGLAESLVTMIYSTTTSPVKVLDSAVYGVDCYVYMKNQETVVATAQEIYIGITEGTQNDMGTESGTDDRTMIMKAGDFAFFPWAGDQDIYVEGNSAGDKLEIWVFKQS